MSFAACFRTKWVERVRFTRGLIMTVAPAHAPLSGMSIAIQHVHVEDMHHEVVLNGLGLRAGHAIILTYAQEGVTG